MYFDNVLAFVKFGAQVEIIFNISCLVIKRDKRLYQIMDKHLEIHSHSQSWKIKILMILFLPPRRLKFSKSITKKLFKKKFFLPET